MSDPQSAGGPAITAPDPDGFRRIQFSHPGFARLFPEMLARAEGEARARVRVVPGPESLNVRDTVHGGYLLGFVDQAIFVGPATLGVVSVGDAVTLGISSQFVGAGRDGVPLDCVVDVVRRTRQLLFVTGLLEQEGEPVLTFQATLRTFQPRDGGGA